MRHALIVQNEGRWNVVLRRVLAEKGYDVEVAVSGEEGLNLVTNDNFDLVILDPALPKGNGIEVCRQIRQEQDKTAIILVTTQEAVEERIDGLNAGADDCLVRPFAMTELLARINAVLRRRSFNQYNG